MVNKTINDDEIEILDTNNTCVLMINKHITNMFNTIDMAVKHGFQSKSSYSFYKSYFDNRLNIYSCTPTHVQYDDNTFINVSINDGEYYFIDKSTIVNILKLEQNNYYYLTNNGFDTYLEWLPLLISKYKEARYYLRTYKLNYDEQLQEMLNTINDKLSYKFDE